MIKGKLFVKEIVEALIERFEEDKEEDYLSLFRKFICMSIDTSDDLDIFTTVLENLNDKIKTIDISNKKSSQEIKVKILFSLPEEYSEVYTTIDANPNISLKAIKKITVKFFKRKIKNNLNKSRKEVNLSQIAY